jgi:hypothetical protein
MFIGLAEGCQYLGDEVMKRRIATLANVAVLCSGIALSSAALAQSAQNTVSGVTPRNLAPLSAEPTRGVVFFTAAINSDGSVASCFDCNTANTQRLGVGVYQVDFGQDVEAINGWSRWVQADTLTTGTENAWCNTADRAGDPNAVWINCQAPGGPGSQGNSKPVDVSFFLFVAR